MGETNVRLKLVIESYTQKVIYGEADKSFIDFLFDLLSLPLGAVIRLLSKEAMVGCLGNLYHSIETFNNAYLHSSNAKNTVLQPKLSFNSSTSTKLLPCAESETHTNTPSLNPSSTTTTRIPENLFSASYTSFCNTTSPLFGSRSAPIPKSTSGAFCFSSSNDWSPFGTSFGQPPSSSPSPSPSRESSFCVKSESTTTCGEKAGFVKGLVTYIVMDDLTVSPISDFSIVDLLKKLNIKDVDSLEEKVITLNQDEGVKLLKASLESKMVLTNVFLRRR